MQSAECRIRNPEGWQQENPSAFRILQSAFCILLLSCGGGQRSIAALTAAPVSSDDRLSDIITAALEADARQDAADSLYALDPVIIAEGELRYGPPRYAGIGTGGAVAVTSSRLEVRGSVAWAQVEYRWLSTREGSAREARVTFVFIPNEKGAWLIRHAHSSASEKQD